VWQSTGKTVYQQRNQRLHGFNVLNVTSVQSHLMYSTPDLKTVP
jgi:hypothetical protein